MAFVNSYNLKFLYKFHNYRRLIIMKLYSDFENMFLGRTFDLDVTTAEYIWFCIENIDDAEHIKNEVRALVLEAQHDLDKYEEELE